MTTTVEQACAWYREAQAAADQAMREEQCAANALFRAQERKRLADQVAAQAGQNLQAVALGKRYVFYWPEEPEDWTPDEVAARIADARSFNAHVLQGEQP